MLKEQLHVEQFSPREIQKLSDCSLSTDENTVTSKQAGKAGHTVIIISASGMLLCPQRRGTPTLRFSLRMERFRYYV